MEIFDMNDKVWKISKHFLPVIDDFVLWGASMVALSNTLILAGGATPKNGPMNLIFEYHKDFGFRLLEDKLQLRRVDHVLLCLTSDELSNVDSLELKIAELPEILLTGGKNNLATYVLKQNETKLLENNNSQQLSGATMFKIHGESESEEIPGFCGGKISHLKISSKCFQWLNETWVEMESLKSPRYGAGSVVNQEQVWILGGTQIDESTEFFDGIEWKSGPKLEKTLSKHCVLNWNDGKTMIIGGKQMESEMERSRHVYIGDWLTNSWTEVNPLNVPRFGHACGKFTLFNGTEVVLVAGGQTGNKMASEIRRLEMYNFQTDTWTLLNQSVPGDYELGLFDAQMIESESGDIFLLGGQDGKNSYKDIYAYNEWFGFYDTGKELPKELYDFVAIEISTKTPETTTTVTATPVTVTTTTVTTTTVKVTTAKTITTDKNTLDS